MEDNEVCEIWRDIKGYEGLYEVSSLGNIKSKERLDSKGHHLKGRMLKPEITKNGRCLVKLSKDGKTKKYQVHILVAKHFVDNPYFYDYVNHLDENIMNNRADNLEWCTSWYNNCYSFNKPVISKNLITGERKFYESVNSAVYDGFNKGHVAAVCRGEEKHHKHYYFKYVTNELYVIGIDESFNRCGITLMCDNLMVEAVSLDYDNCINNSDKRIAVKKELDNICRTYRLDKRNTICIVERIRLFSQGKISTNYILSTSSLVAKIIDTLYSYDIPVHSVETKSWKSQIVGTSKPKENKYGIDPHKWPTILYLKQKGLLKHIAYPYKGKSTKGVIKVNMGLTEGVVNCRINDDVADSICIAMYGFLPKSKQKLKEEKF